MSKKQTVSADGDIPIDARRHRQAFRSYVLGKSASWHREHLGHLYRCWDSWNETYFDGKLAPPYFLFTEPSIPSAYGDYSTVASFGGVGQIRIRPSLVSGGHPALRAGDEFAEGRRRFVEDVGLHEVVHAYQHEVLQQYEDSYKGHGPVFARECNRIGETLGLPPVRQAKARGKNRDLPSCAQWPHCVRPEGYYLGALAERETPGDPQKGTAGSLLAAVVGALNRLAEHIGNSPDGLRSMVETARDLPPSVFSFDDSPARPLLTAGDAAIYLNIRPNEPKDDTLSPSRVVAARLFRALTELDDALASDLALDAVSPILAELDP